MNERYNVYFAGQVMEGYDLPGVRDSLAKVFNADQSTLDRLFSGKAQLVKRDCDEETALKYKAAMERAGAIPIINAVDGAAVASKTAPAQAMTAAEKIAALAAAPDVNQRGSLAGTASQAIPPQSAAEPGSLVLAPAGTAVLREEERAEHITREVDTSGLAVDTAAKRLSQESPPPPAAPDTRHLSMGELGETIPNLPSLETPLSPAIDGLGLSAPGTDFSDCAAPEPQALPLDLSALTVLPVGPELLEEQYRKRDIEDKDLLAKSERYSLEKPTH